MHSDLIDSVELGIKEDWYWTAGVVYRDDHFLVDLLEEPLISGIQGSYWGTPCMEVTFKDGSSVTKECYVGESTGVKPDWFS